MVVASIVEIAAPPQRGGVPAVGRLGLDLVGRQMMLPLRHRSE